MDPEEPRSGDPVPEPEPEPAQEPESGRVPPGAEAHSGRLMGLGALLRARRKAVGDKRGRPLIQAEVARDVHRSVRWYSDLERGATARRITQQDRDALARVLDLDEDGRQALLLYSLGVPRGVSANPGDGRVSPGVRLLLDKQLPSPAYLCDQDWNILAYNAAMAEWWPWVLQPDANLIRWTLTDPEARNQFQNWPEHAAVYVKMLKFAIASRRDDQGLQALVDAVCADPEVQRIWDAEDDVVEHRDGDTIRMILPALGWETVDLISHVTAPASLPDGRLVIITWLQHDDDEHDNVPDSRTPVQTAREAAELAGEGAIALPALSQMIGPDTQLTLAPRTRSVIWATRQPDGQWSIAEVDAYTVITRLPTAMTLPATHQDMKHLTRAVFPLDPQEAAARLRMLVPQLGRRADLFREIYQDLAAEDPALPPIDRPPGEVPPPAFEK
ncbi:helix-turn-helix transcriptional regulator [Streptomyces sp. CA-111067]|uniref:helix-turn-helix transcriptional regulator n=1 Tax=Streptomyces sp. CA-111067 TaxID=3240046 RepID=UPI003D991764